MKKLYTGLLVTLTVLLIATSCSDKDDPILKNPTDLNNPTENANKYVNDWIYEQMNIYYLWNDKIPKSPDFSLKPNEFFTSLLNTYDKNTNPKGDRFSWIQENYVDLLGSLSGVSSDEIGFEFTFAWADEARTHYYALVTYPKLGSDAYEKGIERGRVITQIDNKNITSNNYRDLFYGTGFKTLSMADWVYENNKYILKKSPNVTIKMEKSFAENPILMDSVYTFQNKKIGYMVYNFFATDKGNKSHDYDRLLMDRLRNIQAKGATEMVLDLRYNGGGAVSTALALASALVKDRNTKNVLVTAEYNDILHTAYKRQEGADYNKDYFLDKVYKYVYNDKGNLINKIFISDVPSLNLPRLYVLVTGGSASASELIINGLRPHMDVILIGETTYGKNVGSISLYKKDDPKNKWGMQPIIVKYSNSKGESDFTAGFAPNFKVDEFEALNLRLVKFGDTEDPLLSVALNQITGTVPTRSMSMYRQIVTQPKMIEVDGTNSIFQDKARFEMYDDVRGENIKQLMKEIN